MKKTLSVVLMCMLFCFCACNTMEKEEAGSKEISQAMELINEGNCFEAYTLLKQSEAPEASDVVKCFAFVPTEETIQGDSFSVASTITYKYDSNGNLTTKAGGRWQRKYTYNEKNQIISEYYSQLQSKWEKAIYTYGESGKLLTKEVTNYSGYTSYTSYTYDESGNLSQEEKNDSNNKHDVITYTYDYTYPLNGSIVAVNEDNYQDGYYYSSEEINYEYDEEGRIKTETRLSRNKLAEKIIYNYDEQGDLISKNEIWFSVDGEKKATTTYSYDESRRLLSEQRTGDYGDIYTRSYGEIYYYPDGIPLVIQDIIS